MEESSPPLTSRQFSLSGMFTLVLATSVYFAMVSELWRFRQRSEEHPVKIPLLSIFLGWTILCWCYRRWRLRYAMLVHLSGPVFFCSIPVLFFILVCLVPVLRVLTGYNFPPLQGFSKLFCELLDILLRMSSAGCATGSLISLPAAGMMFPYRMLLQEPSHAKFSSKQMAESTADARRSTRIS